MCLVIRMNLSNRWGLVFPQYHWNRLILWGLPPRLRRYFPLALLNRLPLYCP